MANENSFGLTRKDYMGSKSTLCTGCGHDSVTNHIINAYFKSGISPYRVAKLSGIGCSSKTPTYFLKLSHGFNSIHGRMAPLSTGVKCANKDLNLIGISGDGDTASIGLTGFIHLVRRNSPVVYIVENNGVYGLTKGQFSATADENSSAKSGELNPFSTLDICSLAIEAGCGFVARSFSGDAKQMVPLLSAAMQHPGTSVIDVISPCVTFANHEGSTKSYNYVKDHKLNLQEFGYIHPQEEIQADYEPGTSQEISMADGSKLILSKVSDDFDTSNVPLALETLYKHRSIGEILTGLFHYNAEVKPLHEELNLSNKPLAQLTEKDLRPDKKSFEEFLKDFS